MTSDAPPPSKTMFTLEEYLAGERSSGQRHELLRGEIIPLEAPSREHSLIVANLSRELRRAIGDKGCEVHPLGLRIKVAATGLYTYPDVIVVKERPEFEDGRRDTLLNPKVLAEVLSPATEGYDRGKKFEHYRTLPSLSDYILVAQDGILVEHFARQDGDAWLLREVRSGGRVELLSLDVSVGVDEVYLRVFGGL
jgi:Uma2 family endonuclease